MKRLCVLFPLLLLGYCSQKPSTKPVNSDLLCYGDTVCAQMTYAVRTDTLHASRGSGVEITLLLVNSTSRPVVIDSVPRNTSIHILSDSTGDIMFISPATVQDTGHHSKILNAGDTLRYSDFWHRTDRSLFPALPGVYVFQGVIYGFETRKLYYSLL